jgi:hypothetical protein
MKSSTPGKATMSMAQSSTMVARYFSSVGLAEKSIPLCVLRKAALQAAAAVAISVSCAVVKVTEVDSPGFTVI